MSGAQGNVIPPMTNPLGRYWLQPPAERVLVDNTHAVCSRRDFELLPEYSRSYPTGVYNGKMWRASFADGWYLGWFADSSKPGLCSINFRKLLVVE